MSFSFQESISDFFSLEDTGTFSLSDLLNYFVVFMGARFSCLLTAILYFWPMIDRATGIYEQKINNARPSDGSMDSLEETGFLVSVAATDQKM